MMARWRMAWRNLRRNAKRNVATGMAIGLGFGALITLGGYLNRSENILRVSTVYGARTGHVVIYKLGGLEHVASSPKTYSLDETDQRVINNVLSTTDNIDFSGPQLRGGGLVGNGCKSLPFIAIGIEPEVEKRLRLHPELLRWVSQVSIVSKGKSLWEYPPQVGGIILAQGLAFLLNKTKTYDQFSPDAKSIGVIDCSAADAGEKVASDSNVQLAGGAWSGMMSAIDGEVIGVYNTGISETNNSALIAPISRLRELYDTRNATLMSVWIVNERLLAPTMRQLASRIKAEGRDVELYAWSDERISPMYSGTMQLLHTMVGFICVVLSTIIVFSVFNSSTITVIERSQEIGMMRSLGYTRKSVRRLFLMEMTLLTGLSVVMGGLVCAIGILWFNELGIRFNPPGFTGEGHMLKITPNAKIISESMLFIFGLSFGATLLAVWQVTRMNIGRLLLGTQR